MDRFERKTLKNIFAASLVVAFLAVSCSTTLSNGELAAGSTTSELSDASTSRTEEVATRSVGEADDDQTETDEGDGVTDSGQESTLLPLAATGDPCVVSLTAGVTRYSILVAGEERPVEVIVTDEAASMDRPGLYVDFHGASNAGTSTYSTQVLPAAGSLTHHRTPSVSPEMVILRPAASTDDSPFWSESPTFNLDYLETLWPAIESRFCFDEQRVVFGGLGQGAMLVTAAICHTDIPIAVARQVLGFVTFVECEPSRPVPIIAVAVFEFTPVVGAHWDGSWTLPGAWEQEVTGGMQAAPDALDHWAEIYHCSDERLEETIEDEADLLDRDTLVFSYRECDAPVVAFGLENGPFGFAPEALSVVIPQWVETTDAFLNRS